MSDSLFTTTHMELAVSVVGLILLPLLAIWWDMRRRAEEKHRENTERLIRIETKVEPLWTWWNKTNGH